MSPLVAARLFARNRTGLIAVFCGALTLIICRTIFPTANPQETSLEFPTRLTRDELYFYNSGGFVVAALIFLLVFFRGR